MRPQLAGIWNRIFPKKTHRKSVAGRYAPAIESLESRAMLTAAIAPQWEDASRLTLSFAPEGTLVHGQTSSLTAALGGAGSADQVRQAILSAFQKLQAGTNISVGVVADNGSPLGTVGRSQGDTRFGDIRIAAARLGSSVYAYSVPINSAAAGTWSGEIVFNIDTPLSSLNDVASVALHEAGHVLGLKGNDTAGSMMNESWQPGQLLTPSSTDLAKLVTLYGTRDLDANEAYGSYDGYWTATSVDRPDSFTGTTPLITWGDINVSSDIDWYRFGSPQGYTGTVKIELRTAGISTLAGQISVYNSSGDLLGSAIGPGATSVSFPAVSGSVYVRVKSATSGLTGFGTYALTSSYTGVQTVTESVVDAVAHGRFDTVSANQVQQMLLSGNTLYSSSTVITDDGVSFTRLRTAPGADARTVYRTLGAITSDNSSVTYEVRAPYDSYDGDVLTATIQVDPTSRLVPTITVLDVDGNVIPSTVLVNAKGVYTVQVANTNEGQRYRLRVSQPAQFGPQTGSFELEARFIYKAIKPVTLATGTFTAAATAKDYRLDVAQTTMFLFGLKSSGVPGGSQGIQLWISDSNGNVLYRLVSLTGDTRTLTPVSLGVGSYCVHIDTFAIGTASVQSTSYAVTALEMSDPIGPLPTDPNGNPAGANYVWGPTLGTTPPITDPTTTTTTTTTGTTTSTMPPDQYLALYYYWYWYWFGGGYMM